MKNNQQYDKNSWEVFETLPSFGRTFTLSLSWQVFEDLSPSYRKFIEEKYNTLELLLNEWDESLHELGGDPTYYDWDNFRPLRLSREEDWSDWLVFLIDTSKTGVFAKELLQIDGFESKDYSTNKIEREVSYKVYRADIIISWKKGAFSHIEVKIGDEDLLKTYKTGKMMREKYKVKAVKWTDFLLLLSGQSPRWEKIVEKNPSFSKIKAITWNDVCIAIRKALMAGESIKWKVWAHSFLGAAEQKLIGFLGHKMKMGPRFSILNIGNIVEKTDILKKGLNND